MLRTIYWFSSAIMGLIIARTELIFYKKQKNKLSKTDYEFKINRRGEKWAKRRLKESGAQVNIKGLENIPEGPVVFISNHQSNFDFLLFLSLIEKNRGFIAKIEIKKIPGARAWMEELNCLFMDRADIKQSLKTIIEGIEIVKNGYSLVIFPEGTRSKDGNLLDFKAGSFKLATKSKATIVPVTIKGSADILENNNFRITPANVDFTIHEPIETKDLSKEEEMLLPEKVRDIIASAL